MSSDSGETGRPNLYNLSCTVCVFEEAVEGDFREALTVADDHQEGFGGAPEHFVDIELQQQT